MPNYKLECEVDLYLEPEDLERLRRYESEGHNPIQAATRVAQDVLGKMGVEVQYGMLVDA